MTFWFMHFVALFREQSTQAKIVWGPPLWLAATVFNSSINFPELVGEAIGKGIASNCSQMMSCPFWVEKWPLEFQLLVQPPKYEPSGLHSKNISWSLQPSSVCHRRWWRPDGGKCILCAAKDMTDDDIFCPMLPFYSQVPANLVGRRIIEILSLNFIWRWRSIKKISFQSHFSWLECHKSTPVQRESAEMGGYSCSKGNTGLKVIVSWWLENISLYNRWSWGWRLLHNISVSIVLTVCWNETNILLYIFLKRPSSVKVDVRDGRVKHLPSIRSLSWRKINKSPVCSIQQCHLHMIQVFHGTKLIHN